MALTRPRCLDVEGGDLRFASCVAATMARRRRALCVCRDGGARGAAARVMSRSASASRANGRPSQAPTGAAARHVLCVCRATAARGAVVVGPGRRDTYLLLHVRRTPAPARVARCWGCNV